MAALLLTIAWCKRHKLAKPIAATVDHGLRKGSHAEAWRVGDWARKLGVHHRLLNLSWDGKPPEANIQAIARERRYELIGRWARSKAIGRPIKTLITGHTLDDQAETFLIRLARGSGVDGLAGMAPASPFPIHGFDDLTLTRPLLGFSHQRLVATLRAAKQDWIEDPSKQPA
jgi:tRNA(Ile)-lysidine synthase